MGLPAGLPARPRRRRRRESREPSLRAPVGSNLHHFTSSNHHSLKPALTASLRNIFTVSREYSSRSLPTSSSFFRQVVGHRDDVAADLDRRGRCSAARAGWPRSARAAGTIASISTAAAIIGSGSRPVSATRPANTETQAGGPEPSAAATSRTCRQGHEGGDVLLDAGPGQAHGSEGWPTRPCVLVTGILT